MDTEAKRLGAEFPGNEGASEARKGHTPGPWTIHDREVISKLAGSSMAFPVAAVPSRNFEPDARLIAAAPDLLEALKVCAALINIQNGNLHQDVNAILEMARLAVVKAEGA